jgi:hypothetical protein
MRLAVHAIGAFTNSARQGRCYRELREGFRPTEIHVLVAIVFFPSDLAALAHRAAIFFGNAAAKKARLDAGPRRRESPREGDDR